MLFYVGVLASWLGDIRSSRDFIVTYYCTVQHLPFCFMGRGGTAGLQKQETGHRLDC